LSAKLDSEAYPKDTIRLPFDAPKKMMEEGCKATLTTLTALLELTLSA
jgi:hypothetical protein